VRPVALAVAGVDLKQELSSFHKPFNIH